MNKKLVFILSIFLFIAKPTCAQNNGFEIILNSNYDEAPILFKLANDGSFMGIVNKADQTDSIYISNPFIYKISQGGDTISWKINKQDTSLTIYRLEKLKKNTPGFLLLGTGIAKGENSDNPFSIFIRIDDDMNIVWERIYRFPYYYGGYLYHALELYDGNILYGCSVQGGVNMFLFKLSAQGDSLDFASWTGVGDQSGELWDLSYSPDSSTFWMHTEWAYYQGSGGQVASIVEVDTNLNYLNHYYYPEFYGSPYSSLPSSRTKLITGGSSMVQDMVHQDIDYYISCYILDTNLQVLNGIQCTNPDTVSRGGEKQSIDFIDSSCIFLGGTHNLQSFSGMYPSWMYICKLDDTLGTLYEKYIGGDAYYWLTSVTASPDDGVLLASTRQELSPTFIQRDAVIIKLDAQGNLTGLTNDSKIVITDAIIYPNPGNDELYLRTALKDCLLYLFDSSGRKLLEKSITDRITMIPMGDKTPGFYTYLLLFQGEKIISGTWIKEK